MESLQEKGPETSWFLEALGEIGGFAGRVFRNFFTVVAIGGLFTIAVLLAAYLRIAGGSIWRTPVLFLAVIVLFGIVTIVMAGNLAIVISLAQTVRAKRLGHRVFSGLFEEMGVTDANPRGTHEETQRLHGIPISELREKLKASGKQDACASDRGPFASVWSMGFCGRRNVHWCGRPYGLAHY